MIKIITTSLSMIVLFKVLLEVRRRDRTLLPSFSNQPPLPSGRLVEDVKPAKPH